MSPSPALPPLPPSSGWLTLCQAIAHSGRASGISEGGRLGWTKVLVVEGLTSEQREELRRLRRENKQLKVEREIPREAAAWFARESGYYAWLKRPRSTRDVANDRLVVEMRRIHAFSRRSYGRPRMHAELRDEGYLVNRKRVGHRYHLRAHRLDGESS